MRGQVARRRSARGRDGARLLHLPRRGGVYEGAPHGRVGPLHDGRVHQMRVAVYDERERQDLRVSVVRRQDRTGGPDDSICGKVVVTGAGGDAYIASDGERDLD